MKILVIGGGGREHAIIWRLSKDSAKHELFCAPGNAGTASLATNVPIGAEDIDDLVAWCQLARPDLVVVGPEAPLCPSCGIGIIPWNLSSSFSLLGYFLFSFLLRLLVGFFRLSTSYESHSKS